MTDIEHKLRAALAADDEAFLRSLEHEPGMMEQFGAMFRGPLRTMTILAVALTAIFGGLIVWTGWHALTATSDRQVTLWSAAFIACLIPHGLLRLWFLTRAQHLTVLRELKKIELRILQSGLDRG